MKAEFIGIEVVHRVFGSGIIVALDPNRIIVEFGSTDKKQALFRFPDAFCGNIPYLETNNPILSEYIQSCIQEACTCLSCKRVVIKPCYLNSKKLCEECERNLFPCEECGEMVDRRYISDSEYALCQKCFDRTYYKCSVCQGTYEKRSMPSLNNPDKTEEIWCADCAAEKGFHLCSGCDKIYPDEKIVSLDYSSFCPTCLIEQTHICENCGSRYILGSWDTDEHFCFTCYRRKTYMETLLAMDFSALRVERITPYRLARIQTVPLMTMLCTPYGQKDKKGNIKESCDVILIDTYNKALVLVSGTFPLVKMSAKSYNEATMTEFKRQNLSYSLLEEKHDLLLTLPWSNELLFDVWQNPFLLKAGTYYDRDYRKEWYGDNLVYEGNNYGDTTEFFIVGVLRKNSTFQS